MAWIAGGFFVAIILGRAAKLGGPEDHRKKGKERGVENPRIRYYHQEKTGGFLCERTGKRTLNVFTDHGRLGIFNACENCHDDKRSVGERLAQLNEERKRDGKQDRMDR